MARNISENLADRSIVQRTTIIGIILLLSLFIGIFFLSDWLVAAFPQLNQAIATGLRLLAIWLVITSILRSINSLRPHLGGGILILSGTVLGGASLLFYWIFLHLYRSIADLEMVIPFSWERLAFFTGISLLITLFTLINLRIKNRLIGNILEVLIIAVVIGGILYFS